MRQEREKAEKDQEKMRQEREKAEKSHGDALEVEVKALEVALEKLHSLESEKEIFIKEKEEAEMSAAEVGEVVAGLEQERGLLRIQIDEAEGMSKVVKSTLANHDPIHFLIFMRLIVLVTPFCSGHVY